MKTQPHFSFVLMLALLFPSCNIEKKHCPQASRQLDEIYVSHLNQKSIEGKKKLKILSRFMRENGMEVEPNKYVIVAEEENDIVCNQGTKIHINANAFVSEKTGKPIKGKIKVEVREYYKISEFIKDNLTTTCNDTLLETGGTIFIEAKANGENLKLKEGEQMEIRFPTSKAKFREGMMLFNGTRTSDRINWNLSPIYRNSFYINTSETDTVDAPASFPLGYKALDKFIQDSTRYPQAGHKTAAEGPIFVRFIVRRNGTISNLELVNKSYSCLDSAALTVIKKLPPFKPAIYKKKRCSYAITVPIKFYLWYDKYNVQHYLNVLESRYLTGKEDPDYNPLVDDIDTKKTDNNEYVLFTTNLGWINCDRFPRSSNSSLKIKTQANNILIVFNNMKSLMYAKQESKDTFSIKAPYGEPVTILAFRFDKNKKMSVATKETIINDDMIKNLKYEATTQEEFQKRIERFN